MKQLVRYRYVTVLFLAILTSFPFMGRSLYESSEGRYAMVAKTMSETGNYWIPHLNGRPHLTKPPLTYWAISLGQSLLGMNNYGSRLFHTSIWLLLLMMLVRSGDLLGDEKTGLACGLIFCTALFPSLGFWSLTTDPVLVFFQGLCFWALLEYKNNPNQLWSVLFWMGLGLAFNTKGPVALIPVFFWFWFMRRDCLAMVRTPSLLIFFLLSGFWYAGLELKQPGIILKLWQDEILKRSVSDYSGRNPFWWAPFVLYLPPLFVGWGLWPFFLKKETLKTSMRMKENRMYLFWVSISLLVFFFIQSRLILYILPLTIPVTIFLARNLKDSPLLPRAVLLNLFLILGLKTYGTFFLRIDSDAEQVAQFALESAPGKKVYFLNEYLYGVEFYMGQQFARFTTDYGVFEALARHEPIEWVIYQDRRKNIPDRLTKVSHQKILEQKKQGKWNLIRINKLPD